LTGTDPRLNIFEVSAADLATCNGLVINVPAGSTTLVNISGTDVVMANFGFSYTGATKETVIFNMPEAETLSMSGIGIWGTILAPRADLTFTGGNIDGQLIVQNYIMQGVASGEAHPFYYTGCPWICE
jgi:choice-of-anchor A domain-containing protein